MSRLAINARGLRKVGVDLVDVAVWLRCQTCDFAWSDNNILDRNRQPRPYWWRCVRCHGRSMQEP